VVQTDSAVALVSGGTSGLGLATARAQVTKGGWLVILDVPDSSRKELAEKLGDRAASVAGDVTAQRQSMRLSSGQSPGVTACASSSTPRA
jgi:NAD(P)-dependent dehydrogenase (short-subunit alcohol dehydrogenase family)